MKTYSIFLASSLELRPEREKFENFINRQNKRLVKKNVLLNLVIWEDLDDVLNSTRKQEDYNHALASCEICIVLFWTKMGKNTREEFEQAYKHFVKKKKPKVYVYEKTAKPASEPSEGDTASKSEFANKLLLAEQFHSQFAYYPEFENRFMNNLYDLIINKILDFGEPARLLSSNGPLEPKVFFGREAEMENISGRFENKAQTLLICAEGGLGKTTLAAKYWYENKYHYKYQAWLFCESGIITSLKKLAPQLDLKLQGLEDPEQIQALQNALSARADDFLLVLDNANKPDDILSFRETFAGFNWNVLITSRCRDVVDEEEELNLSHLAPDTAKELFKKYYQEDSPEFDPLLGRLLKAIHYHTLVIEVFAKNLKQAAEMGMNLARFLEKLETEGLYLGKDDSFDIRTNYTSNVQKKAATTIEILNIMYDFSQLNEPERYLLVNLALMPSENYTLLFLLDLHQPENKRVFRDTVKNIFRKGWLGGEDPAYRLSPVVQGLALKKNEKTLWEDGKNLVSQLADLLKLEQEKDNIVKKFEWLPFAKHVVSYLADRPDPLYSIFLNNFAMILRGPGGEHNLLQAKELLEKALEADIANSGETASAVARSRSNLATVLKKLGGEENLLKAKELLEKALEAYIYNFKENAPAVARSRSNLATVFQSLGGEENLLKAKELLEKALEADIHNFKETAPAVALRRSNLAAILRGLGGEHNLLKAKELLEKALEADIHNFKETAPAVAIRRSNLATVLRGLGGEHNLLKAKELLKKALEAGIASFGEMASVVATRRSTLALVLRELGGEENLQKAKELLEKVQESYRANFGENHPNTVISQENLISVREDLKVKVN